MLFANLVVIIWMSYDLSRKKFRLSAILIGFSISNWYSLHPLLSYCCIYPHTTFIDHTIKCTRLSGETMLQCIVNATLLCTSPSQGFTISITLSNKLVSFILQNFVVLQNFAHTTENVRWTSHYPWSTDFPHHQSSMDLYDIPRYEIENPSSMHTNLFIFTLQHYNGCHRRALCCCL